MADQVQKAKFAWSITVFLLGLLGYQVGPKVEHGPNCIHCQQIIKAQLQEQKALNTK